MAHACRQCGRTFIAEDYTNCQDIPPHWRYCPECAKQKGIKYEKQKPWTNRTPEQNERFKKLGERGKQNFQKCLALKAV